MINLNWMLSIYHSHHKVYKLLTQNKQKQEVVAFKKLEPYTM